MIDEADIQHVRTNVIPYIEEIYDVRIIYLCETGSPARERPPLINSEHAR